MKKTVLVTGASRGIGFELVKQYSRNANFHVIACYRSPKTAENLKELSTIFSNISIFKVDVCCDTQIQHLASELKSQAIDILINNAGIYTPEEKQSLGNISVEDMIKTFLTNTVAPLKITEALLQNVLMSDMKTIATITSRLGSIGFNNIGGNYAYRASKSAVNMIMKNLSIECKNNGLRVLLLHPGWVKTEINNYRATLDVETSVRGLIDIIADTSKGESKFYNYNGEEIPW